MGFWEVVAAVVVGIWCQAFLAVLIGRWIKRSNTQYAEDVRRNLQDRAARDTHKWE